MLVPLPARDFDPTEVAIPWRVLTARGHEVRFATPQGAPGEADAIMLDGIGLDPWSQIPGLRRLRLLGLLLRANADARSAYRAMAASPEFRRLMRWDALEQDAFDALLLPGGHRARGMRRYLESDILQRLVAAFFAADKPVGAICHGVLLAARSRDAAGRSVLEGRRTTALTWRQERTADRLARIGRWWDPGYYRTYRERPGEPTGSCRSSRRSAARWDRQARSSTCRPRRPMRAARRSGSGATVPTTRGLAGWWWTGTMSPRAGRATRTYLRGP